MWQFIERMTAEQQRAWPQNRAAVRALREARRNGPLHALDCAAFWRLNGHKLLCRSTLAGFRARRLGP